MFVALEITESGDVSDKLCYVYDGIIVTFIPIHLNVVLCKPRQIDYYSSTANGDQNRERARGFLLYIVLISFLILFERAV